MRRNNLIEVLANRTSKDNFAQYNISPFQQRDVGHLSQLVVPAAAGELSPLIAAHFPDKHFQLTESGRGALDTALLDVHLQPDDEVWIETTTNNFYISGCVTAAIEKHCKWSRTFSAKTRAILLNHEFGFPVEDIGRYRQYGYPIIEDCAFSFFSQNRMRSVGADADYVIISLPKFLPIPWGGGIYSKKDLPARNIQDRDVLTAMVNHLTGDLVSIPARRRANYALLASAFRAQGIVPRFEMKDYHTPGVFMFRTNFREGDANLFKTALNAQGIQSSVFYGEDAYFIPCHQNLDAADIAYLAAKTISVMRSFL